MALTNGFDQESITLTPNTDTTTTPNNNGQSELPTPATSPIVTTTNTHGGGNQTGGMWYRQTIEMREKSKRKKGQGPDGFGQ